MIPIEAALILLLAVVVSNVVARILPIPVPVPLLQIGIGSLIGAVGELGIRLDPAVFFLLFLPPLLFYDGWRTSKEVLWRDKGIIVALALGLVVVTVAWVGALIHLMIPSMPLAVAFALAAIISPTDTVAVSAIAARQRVPHRLLRILEGESLLNDASGLVSMRFAVVAALTGTFSIIEAAGTFVWLALGGVSVGVLVTGTVAAGKIWMTRRYAEDTGTAVVVSLLIPFGAYSLADLVGGSGVLAAVSAGITMSVVEARGAALAITRVRRAAVWETISFAASGVMFVLLGEQLPKILAGAQQALSEAGVNETVSLAVYVLLISVALAIVRFAWVWSSLRLMLRQRTLDGLPFVPGVRLTAAMTLAGVRGAVTLAGILTLPLALADGTPFPTRDLAIFLAAGVIVASLVSASLLLPMLLRGLHFPPEPTEEEAEDRARMAAGEAALAAIDEAGRLAVLETREDAALYADIVARLGASYRHGIEDRAKAGNARDVAQRSDAIERQLRRIAAEAERRAIYGLVRRRELSEDVARKLVREIDLLDARLDS